MKLPVPGTIEIAPSVLSADFSRLNDEVASIVDAGASIVHLDIMDGHFVPNITFGPPIVKSLRASCDLCFDAHLMITEPQKYIPAFAKAGVDHITFHIESAGDSLETVKMIRDHGCTVGVCIKPNTEVETVLSIAEMCDMVLVMTVEPGFGGQSFMPECAEKCMILRREFGANIRIEVDGGISAKTAPIVTKLGADTLVAGSAVFNKVNRKEAVHRILDATKVIDF